MKTKILVLVIALFTGLQAQAAKKRIIKVSIASDIKYRQAIKEDLAYINSKSQKVKFRLSHSRHSYKLRVATKRNDVLGFAFPSKRKAYLTQRGMRTEHRARTTAIHELYHLLGIAHTGIPYSIMNSKYTTDNTILDSDIELLDSMFRNITIINEV